MQKPVLEQAQKEIIKPSEAYERANEVLRLRNASIILEETNHSNIPRVVYHILGEKNGRFLGIIKMSYEAETKVDAETGEVIEKNTPWWVIFISGDNDENEEEQENQNQTEDNQTEIEINDSIDTNTTIEVETNITIENQTESNESLIEANASVEINVSI